MIVFSQRDTRIITVSNDSVVQLPKAVAKAVVKDIIRKDSVEDELLILRKNENLYKRNLSIKDSVIFTKNFMIDLYKEKENNYVKVLDLKDQQLANLKETAKQLEDELKKKKRELRAFKVAGVSIIGFLTYVIVR